MHAIRQHRFGPPDVLRFEEVPDPSPGPGSVRVRVGAAGVHLIDTGIRRGEAGPLPPPELPMTPGREVAGTVDELGSGVDGGWLGRRVVAHLGTANGGYAELAVSPVGALHRLPDDVDDDAAVAMVGTGRTLMGILEVADVRPEDVVLVDGAAGGIGTLAVQAVRSIGATVVGVAGGAEKVDQVRADGADVAVDHRAPGWADDVRAELGDRQVTVVLDGVGGEVGRASMDLLAVGGRLVLFGFSSGSATPLTAGDLYAKGLTASAAIGPRMLQRPGGLRELEERALAALADGTLKPTVQRFDLADAAAAHRAVEGRETIGKVVLLP